MECPKCHKLYQKDINIPLLLIKCGHTLCDSCATTIFNGKSIVCPECNTESLIPTISALPKNMALLAMSIPIQSQNLPVKTQSESICSQHNKKVEAFCQDDRCLLCIDCILLDGHKSHDISPIGKASEQERITIQKELENAIKLEDTLSLMVTDIENFKAELTQRANEKREKVTTVFKEITNVIHERESLLKQNISNILEKEEESLENSLKNIKEHLKSISTFKTSVSLIKSENDCSLLEKSKERQKQAQDANKSPLQVSLNANFPDIKKDSELQILWKILAPQTIPPKPNLYSTTASYANKRTEKVRAPPSKSHVEQHPTQCSNNQNKITKKKNIPPQLSGMDVEKMISPRREMSGQDFKIKNPALDSQTTSKILNTSEISQFASGNKVPSKEESKILSISTINDNKTEQDSENSTSIILPGSKKNESQCETVVLEIAQNVPTTVISMQNNSDSNSENAKDPAVVPNENIDTKKMPNETPKNMQDKMTKLQQPNMQSDSIVEKKQDLKETMVQMPAKAGSSNEIFTSLKEKREKHKKEKCESKVDSDTLKELCQNNTASSGSAPIIQQAITPIKKITQQQPSENIEETKLFAIAVPDALQKNINPPQKEEAIPQPNVQKMSETIGSILGSAQKMQYTPSVTPSLYDLYVNSEECERMDIHSLINHMNQYIYVFCIFFL